MGGRRCTVAGCLSASTRLEDCGVTFHKFPLNQKIRNIWLVQCQMETNTHITKSMNVCSRHFRQADFQAFKGTKYLLKQGAIPTIFPWGVAPIADNIANTELVDDKKSETVTETDEKEKAETKPLTTVSTKGLNNDIPKIKKSSSVDQPENKLLQTTKEKLGVKRSASMENVQKEPQKKTLRKSSDSAIIKKDSNLSQKRFDPASCFTPGTQIEAQDFNNIWHSAKVMEVDNDEREVLIHFESNTNEKSTGIIDEWIPMDSSRLRPLQGQGNNKISHVKSVVSTKTQYALGEKCYARWNDSRKFKATVKQVIDNETYEVLFDDGFVKTLKSKHMSKIRKPGGPRRAFFGNRHTKSLAQKSAVAPSINEWYCSWLNDVPVGKESMLDSVDGKKPSIIVEDNRLPTGWVKHLSERVSVHGKWDVTLVHPTGRKFRNKQEVKHFLDETNGTFNSPDYDFGIHKKKAKDMGVYSYTDDYKKNLQIQQAPQTPGTPIASNSIQSPTEESAISTQDLEKGFVLIGGLKVQIIENLFRCPKEGCYKNFRKENLLKIHIKHYHEEMAKQLGAFPTMTDLAYLRTIGQGVEEPSPKNHLTNQQFFEKVHQQDVHTKTHRKSTTAVSPSTPQRTDVSKPAKNLTSETKVAVKDKSAEPTVKQGSGEADLKAAIIKIESENVILSDQPIVVLEPLPKKRYTLLEEALNNKSAFDKNYLLKQGYPLSPKEKKIIENKIPTPSVSTEKNNSAPIDTEAMIKSYTLSKSKPLQHGHSDRRRGHSRFRGGGFRRAFEKRKILQTNYNDNFVDCEETRHSFGSPADTTQNSKTTQLPGRKQKTQNLSATIIDYSHFHDNTTNSQTTTTTSITEHSQSPQYINENGEIIKIVRMRQEEIINCLCSFPEEDGLMIQCELCLCWQHGICNGIEKESQVPDKYICYICRNPQRGRESMKYIHDQDWLYDGKLSTGKYHVSNPKHEARFATLKESHTLTGNLLELKRFLHSLKVKINIAENKDHPKMYLWSKKWETSPPRGDISGIEVLPQKMEERIDIKTNDEDIVQMLNNEIKKETPVNEEDVPDKSEMEENKDEVLSAFSTGPLIEVKSEDDESQSKAEQKTTPNVASTSIAAPEVNTTPQPINNKIVAAPNIPQPEAAIDPLECQQRLLDHIEKMQTLAMSRLQTIEAQIIALEALDEKTSQLEAVENYPKTKQTIHMLLNDLTTMKTISALQNPI